MKPYYQDDYVTLYHGDCREVLRGLAFDGLWAIVTDPPYGIQHSSNHGASWQGEQISGDEDTTLRDEVLERYTPMYMPAVVFGTWRAQRPHFTRAVLIWDKGPAFGMGDLSFPWKGSFEEVYIIGYGFEGRRDEGVLKGHLEVSWESKGRRHPHAKPVTLLEHFVHKLPGRSILDPFAGAGPTLLAAKNLNRKAIGVEINEGFCEIAATRLTQNVLDFGGAA